MREPFLFPETHSWHWCVCVAYNSRMRALEHAAAVGIFLIHCVVVFAALFGWLFDPLWPLYILLLAVILAQDVFLGYCILSRWEFALRRMLNPRLRYDYTFTSFYTYKLTHKRLSTHFIRASAIVFLSAMLFISIYARLLV